MKLSFCVFLLGSVVGTVIANRRQLGGEEVATPSTYVSTYEIIETFPHDPTAFTQGLAFDSGGNLYESDGLYGHSQVRSIDVRTGETIRSTRNDPKIFGEGIVVFGDRLVQLCWRRHLIFEYSLPGLKLLSERPTKIGAEGWGLASDGETLFVTDSGSSLFHVHPKTFEVLKEVPIHMPELGHKKVHGVNELEWVNGELWGNIYPMYQHKTSECVVRIDAQTGKVIGFIDLRGLLEKQRPSVRFNRANFVLNGIAYHEGSGRLYVTGKKWDKMYQIRLKPAPRLDIDHVMSVCNLALSKPDKQVQK